MKPLPLAIFGLILLATPALAQNSGQVTRARGGASCPGCNLFQADFAGAVLKGRNFAHARLRQADMSTSIMNRTSFTGADLRDVNGYAGVFTGVNFARSNMTNANFVGAYLQGANFRGATLNGVNFSGAEMNRAIGLSQTQLNHACGDASTTLPSGFNLPACQ